MIRAEDLMIGDWAYIYHPTRERIPVKVDGVWIETIERINNGLTREDSPMFRIVEPIPLTPEILEKNEFEKLGYDGWEFSEQDDDNHSLFTILWRNDYAVPHLRILSFVQKYGEFSSFNIRYVHELQHALRLCGIEKEIVI